MQLRCMVMVGRDQCLQNFAEAFAFGRLFQDLVSDQSHDARQVLDRAMDLPKNLLVHPHFVHFLLALGQYRQRVLHVIGYHGSNPLATTVREALRRECLLV